jgi:Ca2+-binding EF-hand superfamily protein
MRKAILIGAAAAGLAAAPAVAQRAMHDFGPTTRAELEAKIAEHFGKVDTNKDGAITKEEAESAHAAMLERAKQRMAERHAARFADMDADKNGSISRSEWDAAGKTRMEKRMERREGAGADHKVMHRRMMQGGHMLHGRMGAHMFERADTDKDGRITLAEAKTAALARFDKVDADKNGTISPEERRAAHEAMRAKWREKPSE